MTNESEGSSAKADLLNKYTKPHLVKPAGPVDPDEDEDLDDGEYHALQTYREVKRSPRFRIKTRTGVIYGCSYAHLLGWLYTPPDTLSIQTTTHTFILEGKDLHKIESALLRERVMELREFRPGEDKAPAAGEPVIQRLSTDERFKGQS